MSYLKISQYIYLCFAVYFAYYAFKQYQANENFWLSVIIALVALGMFFFRRKWYNKHQNKK